MSKEHAPFSRKEEEEKKNAEVQQQSGLVYGKGNATYNRMMNKLSPLKGGSMFKKKSKVSQPGDASELQADAVAKAVTEGNVQAAQLELQHDVSSGESITAKASDVTIETPPGFDEQIEKMKGGGLPLPDDKKSNLEEMLGTDLDHVRLHTGSDAATLAGDINALAFATGNDIFYPGDLNDEELLAHEVTHVVQGNKALPGSNFAKINRDILPPVPYSNSFEVVFGGDRFQITVYCDDLNTAVNYNLDIAFIGPLNPNMSNQPVITKGFLHASTGMPPLPVFIGDGVVIFRSGTSEPQLLVDSISPDKFRTGVDSYIDIRRHSFTLHNQDYSKTTFLPFSIEESVAPQRKEYKDREFIPDIPGGLYTSIGTIDKGLFVRVDGNGDMSRELLIKIMTLDNINGKLEWEAYNYDTKETFKQVLELTELKNNLKPENGCRLTHGQRTDGTPEVYSSMTFNYTSDELVSGQLNVKIAAPVYDDSNAIYKAEFGSQSFEMSFARSKIKNMQLASASEPAFAAEGTIGIDLKLGPYQDRFRLILRPIPGESKTKVILFCTEGGLVRSESSIILPYLVSCSPEIETPHTSEEKIYLKFNLDGDPAGDFEIHDRVGTTSTKRGDAFEGEISSFFRYHFVHMVIPEAANQPRTNFYELYKIEKGAVKPTEAETASLNVFEDYVSYFLPEDFDINHSPANYSAFTELSYMILQVTDLRNAIARYIPGSWENGVLVQRMGSDEMHAKWGLLCSSAYMLYPFKMSKINDATVEKCYSAALDSFVEELRANVKIIEADDYFSSISIYSPDKSKVSAVGENAWNELEDQVLYYARKYTEVLLAAAEKNTSEKEKADDPLTFTNYKSVRANMRAMEKRLERFAEIKNSPGLKKVRAVHYPMATYDQLTAIKGIRSIPLDIYYWKNGDEWQIYDMTNPDKIYETDMDVADGDVRPPQALFEMLNDSDYYYTGRMIVELPDGTIYEFTTKSEKDWTDYLGHIAIALALIGLALTGIGAVAEIAVLGTIGTIFLVASTIPFVASSIMTLADLEARDQLLSARALLEVANIVLTIATLGATGAGSVLAATREAEVVLGSLALVARASKAVYVPLKAAETVGAGMVVLAMSIESYQAIKQAVDSKGNPEDVIKAVQMLLMQAIAMGMLKSFLLPEAKDLKLGDNLLFGKAKGRYYAAIDKAGFMFDAEFSTGFVYRKLYTIDELLAHPVTARLGIANDISAILANPNLSEELRKQFMIELGEAMNSDRILDFSFIKAIAESKLHTTEQMLSPFRKANEAIHGDLIHKDSKIVLHAKKGSKYELMTTSKDRYRIDPVDEAEIAYVDKAGRVRVNGWYIKSMPVFPVDYGFANPEIMAGITAATKVVKNVTAISNMNQTTTVVYQGDVDLSAFFRRFLQGKVGPPDYYHHDGIIFQNNPNSNAIGGRLLPVKPYGFYREYYIPLPNNKPDSPLRLLIGNDGKMWLSPDHYDNIIPLN